MFEFSRIKTSMKFYVKEIEIAGNNKKKKKKKRKCMSKPKG